MRASTKIGRAVAASALAAGVAWLGGCARTTAWDWSAGPGAPAQGAHTMRPGDAAGLGAAGPGTDPGVAVFARSGAPGGVGPHAERRDSVVSSREESAIPDRLAWPEASRADLGRTRSVRTSRSAERWLYPDTRRDPRRGPSRRGGPVYPPHRGW